MASCSGIVLLYPDNIIDMNNDGIVERSYHRTSFYFGQGMVDGRNVVCGEIFVLCYSSSSRYL